MKKKMMAALLAGMMILAAGCGNKAGKVNVGEYKGLALTTVTQADVDAEVNSMLESYSELVAVDRAAVEGDTVNIDYVGTKDGVAFENGSDEDFDLKLGSDSFIDGFEDGLIGAVAGEIRELNLTFPEEYKNNEELAGQAVVFKVTVNEVKETVVPKLTDEFIAEKSSKYTTVGDYLVALRENMNLKSYYEQVTEQLMASSEVVKYNEKEVAERKAKLIEEYRSYAEYYGSYYGLDADTAIMYFLGFESIDAFEEEMGNYAYDVVKNSMIIDAIAKAEKIEVSDELYDTKVTEMAEYYGYDDVAAFVEENGKDLIVESILSEQVMEFIIDNAVITESK